MTIADAISQANELRPNTFSTREKINWLRRAESMIHRTVLCHYSGTPEFEEFGQSAAMERELVVPEPWSILYVHWLEAQIHYANGEYDRYNNAITVFNDNLAGYRGEVARTYQPKEHARFRF